MLVHCPTGLVVDVRGLGVKETNHLIDRRKLKEGFTDHILRSCVESIANPGHYPVAAGYDPSRPFNWAKATVADRTAAMVGIRIETYGEEYEFDLNCMDEFCRKRIKWVIKISDLPQIPMPPDVLEAWKGGNRVPYTMPNGTKILYKALLLGEDANAVEPLIEKMPDQQVSLGFSVRIAEIEGVSERQKMAWIGDLPMKDLSELRKVFDESDAGYDNQLLVKCPTCQMEQEVRVPFDRTFFLQIRGRRS